MANTTLKNVLIPSATNANLAAPTDVVVPDSVSPTFTNITVTGYEYRSTANGLSALVGGAQAGTALTAMINRVTTVTSAADSVQLPVSLAGASVVVVNAAAVNSMNVFGQTGDIINALSANAAFAIAAGKTATFYCTAAGRWHSLLSA